MIKVNLTNDILKDILEIEKSRYKVSDVKFPKNIVNKLRKNWF